MRMQIGNPGIRHLNWADSSTLYHIWKSGESEAPLLLNVKSLIRNGLSSLSPSFDIILICKTKPHGWP